MTDDTKTEISLATDPWAAQFADLKNRFPKVREPILVALHILTQEPDISADDAKARAAMHGVRITAASMNGARRLLANQGAAQDAEAVEPPVQRRVQKRERPVARTADDGPEALIRGVVAKLEAQANAEAERLRNGMRKAIAVLQAALGDDA